MKRYKSKFNEEQKLSKNEIDLMYIIFNSIKFSSKQVMIAYDLYETVSKICGKTPIELYKFNSDVDSKSAIKSSTWIDLFFNNAFYDMLDSKSVIIQNFAKDVLQNEKKDTKHKFMKEVYSKNPKNAMQLEKIIDTLS